MTIWYDFTTTLRNRSRNGIANVEWNLGWALMELDGDVRPCALGATGLVAIEPESVRAGALYGVTEPQETIAAPPRSLRLDVVKGLDRRFGPKAAPLTAALSDVYQLTRRARSRALAAGKRMAGVMTPAATRLSSLVAADDVVVSMGADWSGELARQLSMLRASTGCRVVTMVYDLIPLTHTHLAFHKDRTLFTSYYEQLLAASDEITCISRQSQLDLLAFAARRGLAAPTTHVLRLGDATGAVAAADSARGDFSLWVGTIERRKNLELLYDALRILDSERHPLPTLVVAGATGWGVDDLLAELRVGSTAASRSVVLLGPVDERTLEQLYARARALLFPSHYEGWGLPLREAAIRGVPVAAGDSPAAREALADCPGATLLSPDDPGEWADFMSTTPGTCTPVAPHTWADAGAELVEIALGTRARARS